MTRPVQLAAGVFAGVAVATLSWLAIVPWDLSTVDENDRLIEGSETQDAKVWAVLGILVLLAFAAALVLPKRATGFAVGAVLTFAVLYTWRGSTARVVGANLWAAGLVVIVPLAVVMVAGVHGVALWRLRSRMASTPG